MSSSTGRATNEKLQHSTSVSASLHTLPSRTTQVLGCSRVVVGLSCMFAPVTIGRIFHLPVAPQSAIFARMTGVREIILGELLVSSNRTVRYNKELRRILWANVAADALDVGIVAYGLATGTISRLGAGLFGCGAVMFIFLGLTGLRSFH